MTWRAIGWTGLGLVATSCGRLHFDPLGDASSVDSPIAAECEQAWLDGPVMSPPVRLDNVNEPDISDLAETLSADGLTLYFGSNRSGQYDLYMAQRSSFDGAFGTPVLVPGVNSATSDSQLTLSRDGLEVFVSSDRGGSEFAIWRATRVDPAAPFGALTMVTELQTPADEQNPLLAADETRLYFAADGRTAGVGAYDIWRAERAERGVPFGTAELVEGVNTGATEASPSTITSERVIVFTSDRPGSAGSLDVWYATRSSTSEPFGPATPLPFNTSGAEYTPFLRPDGCELFFAKSGTDAGEDIFVTRISQ